MTSQLTRRSFKINEDNFKILAVLSDKYEIQTLQEDVRVTIP